MVRAIRHSHPSIMSQQAVYSPRVVQGCPMFHRIFRAARIMGTAGLACSIVPDRPLERREVPPARMRPAMVRSLNSYPPSLEGTMDFRLLRLVACELDLNSPNPAGEQVVNRCEKSEKQEAKDAHDYGHHNE